MLARIPEHGKGNIEQYNSLGKKERRPRGSLEKEAVINVQMNSTLP